MPKQRRAFSAKLPQLQLAWDSVSLSALDKCPRYYQLRILEGWTTLAESDHLRFGLEYQAALEHYDRCRAAGMPYEAAVRSTVAFALTRTWNSAMRRPWTSSIPEKSRLSLCRALVWYLDHYRSDPFQTVIRPNGTPAVEQSFRFDYGFSSFLTGEPFVAAGHLDRVVYYEGRLSIVDHKTTTRPLDNYYFAQYSPNIQVSQYCTAGAVIFHEPIRAFFIDAVQVGVTFARFRREEIPRAVNTLEEFLRDIEALLRQNESYVQRGYWPKRPTACNLYFGCEFREVCNASPELRPKLLRAKFTRQWWDPLTTREVQPEEKPAP